MKFVIFTVLIDNYDWLNDLTKNDINFDAICYTNNQNLIEKKKFRGWNIKDLKKYNPKLNFKNLKNKNFLLSRWYKFNPHVHLKNYSFSLYIDANLELKKNISELILEISKKDFSLGIFNHPYRSNLKEEICHCFWNKKINSEEFRILKNFYFKELKINNYRDRELYENNIRFTNHRSKVALMILNDTFKQLEKYPYRDQVILPIIINKYNEFKNTILLFNSSSEFINVNPHKLSSFKNIRRYIIINSNNKFKKAILFLPNLVLKIIELAYDFFIGKN